MAKFLQQILANPIVANPCLSIVFWANVGELEAELYNIRLPCVKGLREAMHRASPVGSTGLFDAARLVSSRLVFRGNVSALCRCDFNQSSRTAIHIMTSQQNSSIVLDLLGSTIGSSVCVAWRHCTSCGSPTCAAREPRFQAFALWAEGSKKSCLFCGHLY